MNTILKLENVSKTFHDEGRESKIILDINLEIKEGEIFVFLGPSGSGKSTILRLMSGLDKDFGGKILWAGGEETKDASFVFQQFAILPWLTVYQNVELWLIARGIEKKERHLRVMKELEALKLTHAAFLHPHELSGGMKQRVGIARALVINPKVIFMDEAFSEVDSFTAAELRQDLLQIWQERKMTIIMVTHMLDEALELGSRIAVIGGKPAKIEKVLENNMLRPRDKRSEHFFKLEDELFKLIKP